jgi:hypothetical protein
MLARFDPEDFSVAHSQIHRTLDTAERAVGRNEFFGSDLRGPTVARFGSPAAELVDTRRHDRQAARHR